MDKRGNYWRQRNSIYIALEEVDLTFAVSEVIDVREMWEAGISLEDMSKRLIRDPHEVFTLLLDLSLRGRIEKRSGGIYGDLTRCPKKTEIIETILGV